MTEQRDLAGQYQNRRCWVLKAGSSLITASGRGLDRALIGSWVAQIATLKSMGKDVILVSSGAVAEGMKRLDISKRPHTLHELQAAAAVGQMGLIQAYESAFQQHGLHTAQVLLTHTDLADRTGYLNARSTLRTLLRLGVIPVVNENDTVATEEIRFGDNDTLAASVCNLVEAGLLILLTDQQGMFDRHPADPEAKLISMASSHDDSLLAMAAGGGVSSLGRGGMVTKIKAARRAARSGAATIIAHGREPDILVRLARSEQLGTFLKPSQEPVAARKQWLAGQLTCKGYLYLDAGAVKVLTRSGRSLLSVGVTAAEGEFERGELVACLDSAGKEVARGLVNYSAVETRRILGRSSAHIPEILGYEDDPELIHRDNLVMT